MDNDADIAKMSSTFTRIGTSSLLLAQFTRVAGPLEFLRTALLVVSGVFLIAAAVLFFRFPNQATYGDMNPSSGSGGVYDLQNPQYNPYTQRSLYPSTHLDERCDAMGWMQRISLVIMVGSLIVVSLVMQVLPTSPEEQYPIMKAAMAIAAIGSLLMAPCSLRQIFQARRVGQQLAVTEYLSSLLGMLCLLTIGIFFLFCSIYL